MCDCEHESTRKRWNAQCPDQIWHSRMYKCGNKLKLTSYLYRTGALHGNDGLVPQSHPTPPPPHPHPLAASHPPCARRRAFMCQNFARKFCTNAHAATRSSMRPRASTLHTAEDGDGDQLGSWLIRQCKLECKSPENGRRCGDRCPVVCGDSFGPRSR